MNDKYHEMVFEKAHISGVEEWYCPSCGRRFLVQWPPAYKMIILEQGDKDTRHNVSRVTPPIGSFPITHTRKTDLIEDFRLAPWLKWMEAVDFDSRWNKND